MLSGGEGKIGKVSDIRGWDSESGRSVAHVTWASGSTNVYRVGHKGKVDLKYITASSGGFYYKDHLPVLGKSNVLRKKYFFTAAQYVCMCKGERSPKGIRFFEQVLNFSIHIGNDHLFPSKWLGCFTCL